jgi:hypothetical protein
MNVHFEDADFELDIEAMTLAQARAIKKQTGLTIRGLIAGLEDFDPDAMAALYWLMKVQNGVAVDIHKINFDVLKFAEALGNAAGEDEAEEDPTPEAAGEPPTM